jgi:hypothetical protein
MPNNLFAPSTNPSDLRPHQFGRARGTQFGWPVDESKEWLIDTGASIAVITKDNADKFNLTLVAGSASGTTGGGGILIKRGLTTEFEVFDSAGVAHKKQCSLDIGVKPNNHGAEILGMDQLNDARASVQWDPVSQTGRLQDV